MEQARAGEYDEFAAARWSGLFHLARLLTAGDRHRAEDLLQDSLVRLWFVWPKITDEAPEAYVRKVMARAAARPLTALLVAPPGLLGYLGWVGHRMGDYGGCFALQSGAWGHEFGYGKQTLDVLTSVPVGRFGYLFALPFADVIGVGAVLPDLALLPLLFRLRPPAVLVLTLALVLGSRQYFANVSRYLLPAFKLFVPPAVALRRVSLPCLCVVLGIAALASGSYAGYALFELGVP